MRRLCRNLFGNEGYQTEIKDDFSISDGELSWDFNAALIFVDPLRIEECGQLVGKLKGAGIPIVSGLPIVTLGGHSGWIRHRGACSNSGEIN